ncbi:MAG: hypothetical protein AB7P20_02510 [Rhizobiaceae bacterium]|jgi:hypothetical protein|nr:hypothetical protein [Pseudomonadota bacterium]
MLTFAIGSIQGNSAQLADLLEQCYDFAGGQAARYVFLGNFIHRGSDSRAMVEIIINLQETTANRVIALAGENEDLLRHWQIADNRPRWLIRGGSATLRSYGTTSPNDLPAKHLMWLQRLPDIFSDQHRLYVTEERQIGSEQGRLMVIGRHPRTEAGQSANDPRRIYLGAASGKPPRAAAFASDPPIPLAFFTAQSS